MYNEVMSEIIILSSFFVLFCLFVWIEYLRYKQEQRHLEKTKEKSEAAMADYLKLNQTDVGNVGKEMYQRMKARELKDALIETNVSDSEDEDEGVA